MAAKTERRALKMHPRLLWDVIHRQAGTLSKSVLEGVMNSIDAGSTECSVELDQRKLTIHDDGRGFADREEIENFFDTFGYPHEEGDAPYGRFRMGRGQLFAAGRNIWTTNQFIMNVDLKPQGEVKGEDFSLGYELKEVPARRNRQGCHIAVDLYEPMNQWTLANTLREIEASVAWAQIPITLNERVVSRLPSEAKWDLETPDAYILLKRTGSLAVYNLGVLVCNLPASRLGTGGVVVSKSKLDVNFARNAVQASCPVWKRISRAIEHRVNGAVARTGKLDDAGRENMARGLLDGQQTMTAMLKQRLITDVTGSHRQLANLSPTRPWPKTSITSAPQGDRVGDIVMQRKLGVVLSQDTLERFGVDSLESLLDRLAAAARQDMAARGVTEAWKPQHQDDPVRRFLVGLDGLKVVSMDGFRATINNDFHTVDEASLSRGETLLLECIASAGYTVHRLMAEWCRAHNVPVPTNRRVCVGSSDANAGWTDGTENIWINRPGLASVRTPVGRQSMASLLVHEFLHREPDTNTHVHDVEFYKQFHDLVMWTGVLYKAEARMQASLERKLDHAQRRAGTAAGDEAELAMLVAAIQPEHEPALDAVELREDEAPVRTMG